MKINLSINNKEYSINNRTELASILQNSIDLPFCEIWLKGHSTTSICVITNSKSAYALFLEDEMDSGFSSRNPNTPNNQTEDFILSNGQMDEWTNTQVIGLFQRKKVLMYFWTTLFMEQNLKLSFGKKTK